LESGHGNYKCLISKGSKDKDNVAFGGGLIYRNAAERPEVFLGDGCRILLLYANTSRIIYLLNSFMDETYHRSSGKSRLSSDVRPMGLVVVLGHM
jgi:hypothetical protein